MWADKLSTLNDTEIKVLQLICRKDAQIASILNLKTGYIKNVVHKMLAKFDVQTRTELMLKCWVVYNAPHDFFVFGLHE